MVNTTDTTEPDPVQETRREDPEEAIEREEDEMDQNSSEEEETEEDNANNNPPISSLNSFVGPSANLMSATLGAGILSIPYSIYQSGVVGGLILMLFAAVSTIFSIDCLVTAADKFGSSTTYEELVEHGLGKRARKATELSILLFCEGVCVAYIVAAGDVIALLAGKDYRAIGMIGVWTTTMLPLSLLRTMESLQWASSIGILSIALLVVAAMQHAVVQHRLPDEAALSPLLWPANGVASVLQACPMILFAFSCQTNVCAIYEELPDKKKMKWIMRAAVTFCSCLYLSIAAICLWDFGANTKGNVLINYDLRTSSPLVKAAFGSMTTAIIMAFPLNVFPARCTLQGLWANRRRRRVGNEEPHHSVDSPRRPLLLLADSSVHSDISRRSPSNNNNSPLALEGNLRHVAFTLLVSGLALALALVAPGVSAVFGLLGGTVSSLLGFVLPGALGVKVGIHLGWILIVCGVLIGVTTTVTTIMAMI